MGSLAALQPTFHFIPFQDGELPHLSERIDSCQLERQLATVYRVRGAVRQHAAEVDHRMADQRTAAQGGMKQCTRATHEKKSGIIAKPTSERAQSDVDAESCYVIGDTLKDPEVIVEAPPTPRSAHSHPVIECHIQEAKHAPAYGVFACNCSSVLTCLQPP